MRKQLEAIRQDLLKVTEQLIKLADDLVPAEEKGTLLQIPCPHCGSERLISKKLGLPLDYYCLACHKEGEIQ